MYHIYTPYSNAVQPYTRFGSSLVQEEDKISAAVGWTPRFCFSKLHWSTNKNCRASAIIFCVDGYYNLTGDGFSIVIGKGVNLKGIMVINVSSTWSILGLVCQTPKKPQSWACKSKNQALYSTITLNYSVSVLEWSGHSEGDVWFALF